MNTRPSEPDHIHRFILDPHTGYDCRCGASRPLDYRGETITYPHSEPDSFVDLGDGFVGFAPVLDPEYVRKASAWLNGETKPRTVKARPIIYIAGPMSGHQDFNYHAFHYAAHDIRAAGYRVLNPAENPKPNSSPSWQDWMRVALGQLIQADAIALLPGWNYSKGAMIEERIARDLGLDVQHVQDYAGDKNYRLYVPSASSK